MRVLQYSGLGCACSAPTTLGMVSASLVDELRTNRMRGMRGLGAVSDYDYITIGGKQYSANQIVDKQIIASRDVTLYPSLSKDDGKFTVKSGQTIGKVFSYLLPTSKNNPTGKVVLQFERGYNNFYWLKDDNAVSQSALKDQGTLTVAQEVEAEKAKLEKEADPVSYYFKKLGVPVLLTAGAIYLVATFGKAFIVSKVRPKSLNGYRSANGTYYDTQAEEKALAKVVTKNLNKSERDRLEIMQVTSSKADALKSIIEGTAPNYLSPQLKRIAKKFDIQER